MPLSASNAHSIFGCAGWELSNLEFPLLPVKCRFDSTSITLRVNSVFFARVANWEVTAQNQGAQRWLPRTSLSFLLSVLNAGVTLLCSPSLTQVLPGHRTVREEGTGQHPPTITRSTRVATAGPVSVSGQSKPIKEDNHFYSLKRCKATFSGLDHAQLNFQILKVHCILLECIQPTEVISWTPLPYGLLKKFRN